MCWFKFLEAGIYKRISLLGAQAHNAIFATIKSVFYKA